MFTDRQKQYMKLTLSTHFYFFLKINDRRPKDTIVPIETPTDNFKYSNISFNCLFLASSLVLSVRSGKGVFSGAGRAEPVAKIQCHQHQHQLRKDY